MELLDVAKQQVSWTLFSKVNVMQNGNCPGCLFPRTGNSPGALEEEEEEEEEGRASVALLGSCGQQQLLVTGGQSLQVAPVCR
ncbi:hypothetical protein INR49_018067, partial [Caranx melampygus]